MNAKMFDLTYDLSGLEVFAPTGQGRMGIHEPYRDKLCVIAYPDGQLILSPKVVETMNTPDRIVCLYDRLNRIVGFASAQNESRSYKVQYDVKSKSDGKNHAGPFPRISSLRFSRYSGLSQKDVKVVWLGIMIAGKLIIDVKSQPYDIIDYKNHGKNNSK